MEADLVSSSSKDFNFRNGQPRPEIPRYDIRYRNRGDILREFYALSVGHIVCRVVNDKL